MPRFTRLAGTAILAGSVRAFQPQLKNYDSISRSDASSSSNVAVYWGVYRDTKKTNAAEFNC